MCVFFQRCAETTLDRRFTQTRQFTSIYTFVHLLDELYKLNYIYISQKLGHIVNNAIYSLQDGPKNSVVSRGPFHSTFRGEEKNSYIPIYFRPFIGAPFHSIYNDQSGPIL